MGQYARVGVGLVVIISSGIIACGGSQPGRAAEAVRPDAPNAATALGEKNAARCEGAVKSAEPLVIDWTSDDRIDLELAMKKSVAVVSYDCASIKLLKECKVEGDYGFIGVSKKERVVKLESSDEITANLPMQGLAFVAKLGGELERGASLDLALVMIGKKRTTLESVSRQKLVGNCAGATHFVRGATIGAFAMASGSKGHVATVTEIFGGGASTDSASKRFEHNTDGERSACASSDPEASGPPKQCQSALRLELSAIASTDAVVAEKTTAAPEVIACPAGMVASEDKVCTKPKEKETHLCKQSDIVDCATQCERGHAGSCRVLGYIYESEKKEYTNATEYYLRACDGDDAVGCSNAAYMHNKARGVPENIPRAFELFKKACDLGNGRGCSDLGFMHENGRGVAADAAGAAKLYKRGCDGGNMVGCGNYGHMLAEGLGVTKDTNLALTYYTRGCVAGDARSCNGIAFLYEKGNGVPADMTKATEYYVKACSTAKATRYGAACANAGYQLMNGRGIAKDLVKAYASFELACSLDEPRGCANLGSFYEKGEGGKPQDLTKARQYYEHGCKGGNKWGCDQVKRLAQPVASPPTPAPPPPTPSSPGKPTTPPAKPTTPPAKPGKPPPP